MFKFADRQAVIDRINNTTGLTIAEKIHMINRIDSLSNESAKKIYRHVNFGEKIPLPAKRLCDTTWTNHGKYRSELRDINPHNVNKNVCDLIYQKHFDTNNPTREPPKHDNLKVKSPEGTVVLDYDSTHNPSKAKIITIWASERKIMRKISKELCEISKIVLRK